MPIRRLLVRSAVLGTATLLALGTAVPAMAAPAPDPNAPTIATTASDPNATAIDTRPGASKTVWLVFEGGSLTGTPWNANRDPATLNGSPIDFAPSAATPLRCAATSRSGWPSSSRRSTSPSPRPGRIRLR